MSQRRAFVAGLGLRLLLAWLLTGALLFFFARPLIAPLQPLVLAVLQAVHPQYDYQLSLQDSKGSLALLATATVREPIALTDIVHVEAGHVFEQGGRVIHALVPVVILFSVLVAWPVKALLDRVLLLLLAVPVSVGLILAVVPFQLAGRVNLAFQQLRTRLELPIDQDVIIQWMVFCETGGRWLLPLLAAIVCIALVNLLRYRRVLSWR